MIEIYSNNKKPSNAHLERQRKENGNTHKKSHTINIQRSNTKFTSHKKNLTKMVNNNAKLAILWRLDITAKYNKNNKLNVIQL